MFEIFNQLETRNLPIKLEIFNFPGGEVHFRMGPAVILKGILIKTDLHTSDEVMLLVAFADQFRHLALTLELMYTPYARMDRRESHNEPFSFRAFARIINMCGFKRVIVYDPHSYVTPALLDNVFVKKRLELVKMWMDNLVKKEEVIIVSPDAGAMKTNQEIAQHYGLPHISATKVRDVKTGEITATQVHTDLDLNGKYLLVLDDICDGGRTFIELSKVLRKYKPKTLHLSVTVGIFSKGIECVLEHFDALNTHYTMKR